MKPIVRTLALLWGGGGVLLIVAAAIPPPVWESPVPFERIVTAMVGVQAITLAIEVWQS